MKKTGKIGIFSVALVSLILTGPSLVPAESDYPNRQIEVVIPLAAGGGTDQAFAPFKEKVQKILGQPIVISYKPGPGRRSAPPMSPRQSRTDTRCSLGMPGRC